MFNNVRINDVAQTLQSFLAGGTCIQETFFLYKSVKNSGLSQPFEAPNPTDVESSGDAADGSIKETLSSQRATVGVDE